MKVPHPPPWPIAALMFVIVVAYYAVRSFWRWITDPNHYEALCASMRFMIADWRQKP